MLDEKVAACESHLRLLEIVSASRFDLELEVENLKRQLNQREELLAKFEEKT